jgi:hypothetical protein
MASSFKTSNSVDPKIESSTKASKRRPQIDDTPQNDTPQNDTLPIKVSSIFVFY